MLPRTIIVRLFLILFLAQNLALQAETPAAQNLRSLCLVIANGWTLAIRSDGSASLFRTQKHQLRSEAPPGTFAYDALVDAIKTETAATPHPNPSAISFYFSEFDRPAITEIAPIPKIRETLSHAQSIFLTSISPLIRQLLHQYPLITHGGSPITNPERPY